MSSMEQGNTNDFSGEFCSFKTMTRNGLFSARSFLPSSRPPKEPSRVFLHVSKVSENPHIKYQSCCLV